MKASNNSNPTALPLITVHLEGSLEDIAKAHGYFTKQYYKEKIENSALYFYSDLLERKLRPKFGFLTNSALFFYELFFQKPMLDEIPSSYKSSYAAFSQTSGIPNERVWNALTVPDLGLVVSAKMHFGCTSLIWDSDPTKSLHTRTLDYTGTGLWEKNTTLFHVVPSEGHPYISIGSLGIHALGLTGFNSTGLTLAVHQLRLSDVEASGVPVAIISNEILRLASSIDEAIEVIKSYQRSGSWAYVLSQGHDKAVIETSATSLEIRRSSTPFFFQTNHPQTPQMANQELKNMPGFYQESRSRLGVLQSLEPELKSKIASVDRSLSIFSKYPIARADNIQTVIFSAREQKIWLKLFGENKSDYAEIKFLNFKKDFDPKLNLFTSTAISSEDLSLRSAYHRFEDHHDQESLETLNQNPNNSNFFQRAWITMKLQKCLKDDLRGLIIQADELLRSSEYKSLDAHMQAKLHLTRAALLSSFWGNELKNKPQELSDYLQSLITSKNRSNFKVLQKRAVDWMKKPFNCSQAKDIELDWVHSDFYRF